MKLLGAILGTELPFCLWFEWIGAQYLTFKTNPCDRIQKIPKNRRTESLNEHFQNSKPKSNLERKMKKETYSTLRLTRVEAICIYLCLLVSEQCHTPSSKFIYLWHIIQDLGWLQPKKSLHSYYQQNDKLIQISIIYILNKSSSTMNWSTCKNQYNAENVAYPMDTNNYEKLWLVKLNMLVWLYRNPIRYR